MSRLIIVTLVMLLSGCAGLNADKQRQTSSNTRFDLPMGALTLVVDDEGKFISARAFGLAEVLSDTAAGKEAAMTAAALRARRTLVEFLSNEITSSQSINQIARASSSDHTYVQR